MTRLSLSLFLLALFFCGVALVTMNKVETIVTILTVIVAAMCALAGWAYLEWERHQRTPDTLDSLIVEFANDIPDKIESPRFIAPNSSLPKPEIHQRTSDITPSPRRIPDVGEVRKQRPQRLETIVRNYPTVQKALRTAISGGEK